LGFGVVEREVEKVLLLPKQACVKAVVEASEVIAECEEIKAVLNRY
jgi:hypothetical protein